VAWQFYLLEIPTDKTNTSTGGVVASYQPISTGGALGYTVKITSWTIVLGAPYHMDGRGELKLVTPSPASRGLQIVAPIRHGPCTHPEPTTLTTNQPRDISRIYNPVDRCVVCAPPAGMVCVLMYAPGSWPSVCSQEILGSAEALGRFGSSVATSDDGILIAAGAPFERTSRPFQNVSVRIGG
jgi:hypothetical protein